MLLLLLAQAATAEQATRFGISATLRQEAAVRSDGRYAVRAQLQNRERVPSSGSYSLTAELRVDAPYRLTAIACNIGNDVIFQDSFE